MSAATDAGYLTDVEYTGNFYQFLTPSWLSYIATINGYEAPALDRPFTYCELGCGKGLTSLALAALHPNGNFHACDFNAVHIDYAEQLRRQAEIGNARFYPQSFGEMLSAEIPQFDFIVAHGVYSWVPEHARAEIHDFLKRKLKPGGLAMISYNAMPGWAHLQPIRQMMQAFAATAPGDSLEKARAAFEHVTFLANNGASFFKTTPAAAEHLKFMAQQDIRYIAHEYLTPHGDPFHFQEISGAMSALGLAFAGNMTPKDNYVELMVPPRFQDLLAKAPTRLMLETHRDVIENTTFRQDLYAAQPAVAAPSNVPLSRIGTGKFCLAALPEDLALKRNEQAFKLDTGPDADAVRSIHALLLDGPATTASIHLSAAPMSEERIAILIQRLVIAGHIVPCPPVRTQAGWLKLNAVLVEAGLAEHQQKVCLVCPTTGSGKYSEVVYAAMIESAVKFDDADGAARNVLSRLRTHRHPVNRSTATGERRAATDQEVLDYVATTWHALKNPLDPGSRLLHLLGVIN